jgi:hypothetical protein
VSFLAQDGPKTGGRPHPVGWAKARFFRALGFHEDAPDVLQAALLRVAQLGVVVATEQSSFGARYVVDGYIGEQGRSREVRTIWILELGSMKPRFVTAYPAPGPRREE